MLEDHLNQNCVIDYYASMDKYSDYVKVSTVSPKCRKEIIDRIIQKPSGEYYTATTRHFVGFLSTNPRAWQDKIDDKLIASVEFMTNGEGFIIGYTILS